MVHSGESLPRALSPAGMDAPHPTRRRPHPSTVKPTIKVDRFIYPPKRFVSDSRHSNKPCDGTQCSPGRCVISVRHLELKRPEAAFQGRPNGVGPEYGCKACACSIVVDAWLDHVGIGPQEPDGCSNQSRPDHAPPWRRSTCTGLPRKSTGSAAFAGEDVFTGPHTERTAPNHNVLIITGSLTSQLIHASKPKRQNCRCSRRTLNDA